MVPYAAVGACAATGAVGACGATLRARALRGAAGLLAAALLMQRLHVAAMLVPTKLVRVASMVVVACCRPCALLYVPHKVVPAASVCTGQAALAALALRGCTLPVCSLQGTYTHLPGATVVVVGLLAIICTRLKVRLAGYCHPTTMPGALAPTPNYTIGGVVYGASPPVVCVAIFTTYQPVASEGIRILMNIFSKKNCIAQARGVLILLVRRNHV